MKLPEGPPGLFLRFFRWFCHPELKKYIEGDLIELYNQRVIESGKINADWKFRMDVLLLFRRDIIRPSDGYHTLNNYGMLMNYLKTGVRNILKYKVFSFINVFGLAVAMAVCMLIILMLADQKRYDAFHEKKDRIYRILSDAENNRQPYATSPYPLANTLKIEYPIIEESTSLTPGVGGDVSYQQKILDMRGYFADPSFFRVFSFELEMGNSANALSAPNSMVITSDFAYELFNDENPIGKTVEFADRQLPFPQEQDGVGSPAISWGTFTITGVMDEHRYKSHLKFDVLVSSSSLQALYAEKKISDHSNDWEWYFRTYTYVLLGADKTSEDLIATLRDLGARKYAGIKAEHTKGFKLLPQKLTEVQLGVMGNDTNNRLPLFGYYFLSFLALTIMLSACLNYTNLSIARALTRAKEIGVRKVTGASRSALIFQFLSESIITALLALVMSIILLLFIRPAFMGLWINKHLNFELPATLSVYFVFTGFAVLIGIIAGVYPALHLSGYQPIKALKSGDNIRPGKLAIRKVLSVSQFVISLFFITTSILIFNQFRHFQKFDYGFNSTDIINIELQGVDYRKLSNELASVPGVFAISASDIIPSTGRHNGVELKKAGSKAEFIQSGKLMTDENFIGNLGLTLIAGSNLRVAGESSDRFILVNEVAVRKLGYKYPAEIIGAVLEVKGSEELLEVMGVVKDFRYNLLINTDEIGPLMLRNQPGSFMYVSVKISSHDPIGTIAKMETKWRQVDPIHPFKYEFYDDQLATTHQGIFDLVSIVSFVAFLAITIACMGLLGMATYTAERRRKEVGIRKVLGAEEFSIALLLSKEFVKMMAISVGIAGPLSYFINNLWLQKFPNRVDFGVGTVFTGILILFVLGLLTVGSQTLRASKANPVDSLKMD